MDGLQVESVDALSLDEALLLARKLPHLRELIRGTLPGVDRDTSRRLALGVLNVAQGHPKLLELADGQAADPARLAALVEAGDQAWRAAGGLPDGFFATGQSVAPVTGHASPPVIEQSIAPASGQSAAPATGYAGAYVTGRASAPAADYLRVLAAWTTVVAGTLAAGERVLF